MDLEERRYRAKWAVITVVSALAVLVGGYAWAFTAWSGTGGD
ncbi:hypothetical protein VD659_05620 [Herbiconiux sp. 11R-BC]